MKFHLNSRAYYFFICAYNPSRFSNVKLYQASSFSLTSHIQSTAKRCAIIGAGPCGLTSARWAKQYGYEPVVFECTERIGGMWNYKPQETRLASVMKSTVINTSKELTAFSDFPPPAHFANYMHNRQMLEYMQMYSEHHDIDKHILFDHTVENIERAEDFDSTGRWNVQYRKRDGTLNLDQFEAVLLCTGHHSEPQIPPKWPGQDKFKGRIMHAHSYKDGYAKGFENSVVVVMGIGNSGGDVAVEQSRIAKETILSTRRGSWILQKVSFYGLPIDMFLNRRLVGYFKKFLPNSLLNRALEAISNLRFDHAVYGLRPKHRFTSQHPTVNDELPNRMISGMLKIKPNIEQFTENGIIWSDGTETKHVDNVVLCTGYLIRFPLLEHGKLIPVEKNEVPTLYKYVWPVELSKHNTFGIIGLIQPIGSIMPISEMQARVFFNVLAGKTILPSKEMMLNEIRQKREANAKQYVDSLRHTIQVDFIGFMDELGDMMGCTARPLKTFFLKSPRLAMRMIFGQVSPYQYRIFGPYPWPKAIKVSLDATERALQATKWPEQIPSSLSL